MLKVGRLFRLAVAGGAAALLGGCYYPAGYGYAYGPQDTGPAYAAVYEPAPVIIGGGYVGGYGGGYGGGWYHHPPPDDWHGGYRPPPGSWDGHPGGWGGHPGGWDGQPGGWNGHPQGGWSGGQGHPQYMPPGNQRGFNH